MANNDNVVYSHSNSHPEFRLLVLAMSTAELRLNERTVAAVLPMMRHACIERGIRFALADPCIGPDGYDSYSVQDLVSVLREIDAGAFCIGLIGSDYSMWRGETAAAGLPALVSASPWIAEALERQLGPCEIMMREGILRKPERMKHRAAFFNTSGSVHVAPLHHRRRLQGLMRDARRLGFPLGSASTESELTESIRTCLLKWLDIWFPVHELRGRIASERRDHEAFRDSYCPIYRRRSGTFSQLDAVAWDSEGGLLLVGAPAGWGKTSLLVNWVRDYRNRYPDAFIIEHYVGAVPASRNPITFMRRVLWEMKEQFAIAEDVPLHADGITNAYHRWLAVERKEPVLMVIDGIDGFDGAARPGEVLPSVISGHLRIVASVLTPEGRWPSSVPESAQRLQVPALSLKEFDALVRQQSGGHGASRHGLAIRIAAMTGVDDTFLKTLLMQVLADSRRSKPEATAMLLRYEREIKELEQVHGEVGNESREAHRRRPVLLMEMIMEDLAAVCNDLPVRAFLRALWASRDGLTPDEVLAAIGSEKHVDEQHVTMLVDAFRPCLSNPGGPYVRVHDRVLHAIERLHVRGPVARSRARLELAAVLAKLPRDSRRTHMRVRLLKEAGDARRLNAELCRIETVCMFHAEGREHELLVYWNGRSSAEIERRYLASLERFATLHGRRSAAYVEACGAVASLLQRAGRYPAAARLLAAERLLHVRRDQHSRAHADCLNRLADAKLATGHPRTAGRLLERVLGIQQQLGLEETIEHADTHRRLAGVFDARGRHHEALTALETAEKILRMHLGGQDERRLRNDADRGVVLFKLEKYEFAEDVLRATLAACEQTLGQHHTLTMELCNSLGTLCQANAILSANGRADGVMQDGKWLLAAREFLERTLSISRALFPQGHPDTTSRMSNLGYQCRLEGDLEAAECLYREALGFDLETFGEVHPRIAGLLINLASVLRLRGGEGRQSGALELLQRGRRIRTRLRDGADTDVSDIELNIASLLKEMGRLWESSRYYRAGLPLRVLRKGFVHSKARSAFGGLVDLMAKLNRSFREGNVRQAARFWERRSRTGKLSPSLCVAVEYALRGNFAAAGRICRGVITRCVRSSEPSGAMVMDALELLAACSLPS
ncbi:MAG TPA: tetratricopeptide repeat protein [Candidatus Kapabacteria bacterium]|nr:tetratricopeptide repeat protein [Candidatus Kapabacteria bacterium]